MRAPVEDVAGVGPGVVHPGVGEGVGGDGAHVMATGAR